MAEPFATVEDVITLWRPLVNEESSRTALLLPIVSDELRLKAKSVGKDLDQMIIDEPLLASAAKEVTVSVISRILRQATAGDVMSQESQSALGYTWSGTYAIPGGGIGNAIFPSDLKRLGLKRQRYGVIEFYDQRDDSQA